MSTAPESFNRNDTAPDSATEDESQSAFWVWFAIGVLMFCWIAEATMCAERGF